MCLQISRLQTEQISERYLHVDSTIIMRHRSRLYLVWVLTNQAPCRRHSQGWPGESAGRLTLTTLWIYYPLYDRAITSGSASFYACALP
jgi:hypothetical protein